MAGLAVKQKAARDRHRQHFFQAEGLRAELRFVAMIAFFLAAFVLHWRGQVQSFPPRQLTPSGDVGEFDHIAHADSPSRYDATGTARAVMTPFLVSVKKGSSTRWCMMRPSAVSAFSCHCRSTWISAHCRRQNRKCWMPERGRSSSDGVFGFHGLSLRALR